MKDYPIGIAGAAIKAGQLMEARIVGGFPLIFLPVNDDTVTDAPTDSGAEEQGDEAEPGQDITG